MKKLIALISIFIVTLTCPALITTNLISPVAISSGFVAGTPVVYYQFQIPAPQFIVNSYSQVTNATFGTNTLGFGASIAISPTNFFSFPTQSTNGQSDTHSASEVTNINVTVTLTGFVTNAGGTNTVFMQWIHQ